MKNIGIIPVNTPSEGGRTSSTLLRMHRLPEKSYISRMKVVAMFEDYEWRHPKTKV
jgi:hypothetical protein